MSEIKEETIENILKYSPSEKIFIKALSVYKIRKSNICENGIIILLCTLISIILGISTNTVSLFTNSVSIFLNVSLSLFGILFTGYAIFQTLLGNRLIIHLFEDTVISKNNITKSKLQETNENFVYLMMLFILGIIINIILNIIMPVIPSNFCLFNSIHLCNVVAIIFIDIFFYIMGVMVWRMVSFIANMFHLLNAYAVSKLLAALDEESDTD